LLELSLSANSPAILNKSKALLASPCSLAAKAAHFAITPSSKTPSLKTSLASLLKYLEVVKHYKEEKQFPLLKENFLL
jgi:hypothetical protein